MSLPRSVLSRRIFRVLARGTYEEEEAQFIGQLIGDDEVVLELGGGLGLISTLAARDPRTRNVVVVEANPDLIPIIEQVHRDNGVRCDMRHGAVMRHPDASHIDFYVRPDCWASSMKPAADATHVRVPALDLQALLDEVQPSLLIVDIEGGEDGLFHKVRMPSVSAILLELHQQQLQGAGMKRVLDELSSRHFAYDPRYSKGAVVCFSRRY